MGAPKRKSNKGKARNASQASPNEHEDDLPPRIGRPLLRRTPSTQAVVPPPLIRTRSGMPTCSRCQREAGTCPHTDLDHLRSNYSRPNSGSSPPSLSPNTPMLLAGNESHKPLFLDSTLEPSYSSNSLPASPSPDSGLGLGCPTSHESLDQVSCDLERTRSDLEKVLAYSYSSVDIDLGVQANSKKSGEKKKADKEPPRRSRRKRGRGDTTKTQTKKGSKTKEDQREQEIRSAIEENGSGAVVSQKLFVFCDGTSCKSVKPATLIACCAICRRAERFTPDRLPSTWEDCFAPSGTITGLCGFCFFRKDSTELSAGGKRKPGKKKLGKHGVVLEWRSQESQGSKGQGSAHQDEFDRDGNNDCLVLPHCQDCQQLAYPLTSLCSNEAGVACSGCWEVTERVVVFDCGREARGTHASDMPGSKRRRKNGEGGHSHVQCEECFTQFAGMRVNERKLTLDRSHYRYTVHCPMGCAGGVDPSMFRTLGNELYMKYRRFCALGYAEDNKVIWCPNRECCVGFVAPSFSSPAKELRCFGCSTPFCSSCYKPPHHPASCQAATSTIPTLLEESSSTQDAASFELIRNSTKPCPRCHVRIFKESGCNHMKCVRCKLEFCWVCVKEWKIGGSCQLDHWYNSGNATAVANLGRTTKDRFVSFKNRITKAGHGCHVM